MIRLVHRGRLVAILLLALSLWYSSPTSVFAHARYDRSEPPSGPALDGSAFVLRAWFTQELTSKSTIRVVDANGVQVDLGDGRVDLDDPVRKLMLVSVPELPPGIYTVEFGADSADDGHLYPGTFTLGVGMEAPSVEPAAEQTAPATP